MRQLPLLRGSQLPCVFRYEILFANLPLLELESSPGPGRKSFDRNLLLRALIYRGLRQIVSLSDLVVELANNPSLLESLGMDPLQPVPTVQRFSQFLRCTPNAVFQRVRCALLAELISLGVISGQILALDSCSVVAPLRENNLKTSLAHCRFSKSQPPKGDPETGVGVRLHFPDPAAKKVTFYWGYRNHTISDVESELTLWEETHPANVSEVTRAVPMLQALRPLALPTAFVTADSEYDAESILNYVITEMHALPIVAHNPRNESPTSYHLDGTEVYCPANLPMAHRGKVMNKPNGLQYRQFGCPIHWRKSYRRQYLLCPIGHPKFQGQKGCNVLFRLTPTCRSQIPYASEVFHQIYQKRIAIERTYARLLAISMQHPTVRGLQANSNHCTVAHITTLLVALTAAKLGQPDKIRWIKSFVPNLLKN